jgi:hypothetical protein
VAAAAHPQDMQLELQAVVALQEIQVINAEV